MIRRLNILASLCLLFCLAAPKPAFCVELGEIDWLKSHPGLLDLSSLSMAVDKKASQPKRPKLGAFGIGGLNAFTLVGLNYPFNTFHNTTTYFHPFFGDSAVKIESGGPAIDFQKESIWYVRDASIALTLEQNDALAMATINYSPPGSGAFVRTVVVKALADFGGGKLIADLYGDAESQGARIVQVRESNGLRRTLTIGWFEGGATAQGNRVEMEIPPLGANEEKAFNLYCIIQTNEEKTDAIAKGLAERLEGLPEETLAWWKDYLKDSTRIVTPDVKLNDMIEAQKIGFKIQRKANGGQALSVKYAGRSHDRENVRITRFLLLAGMPADVREIMMYGFNAARKTGEILNSRDLSLDLTHLPAPESLNWENMPLDDADKSRQVAERPSWTVLQFYRYYKHTDDVETLREVYPYLKRNLVGQDFSPEWLLPFHGDEMYQISYPTYVSNAPLQDLYSLDSSFAFVAAANGLKEIAERLGKTEDAARFEELRANVQKALEKYYWLEGEGRYVTGLYKENLQPADKPFPLIGLKPELTGYKGDEGRLTSNLRYNIKKLRQKDGSLKMGLSANMYHGQLQGMALYAYDRHRYPSAAELFDLLIHKIADPAGMYSEVQQNNHQHVSLSEDPSGMGKEDGRRFGPWESALNVSALINHLTGLEVDAQAMAVKLTPEMPAGWSEWKLLDGRIKDSRFDLFVSDDGKALTYRLVNKGPEPLNAEFTLPIGERAGLGVYADGKPINTDTIHIETSGPVAYISRIHRVVKDELTLRVDYQ